MNPPNSPNSSRHGKRPMIPPFSSSSESSSSSSSPEHKALVEQPQCYVCARRFATSKALFGHMRCHPEREWRGVRPLAEGEESSRGRRKWRRRTGEESSVVAGEYVCRECTRVFETRQALGGHRASHRGVMGCCAKSKVTTEDAMAMVAVERMDTRGERTFVCRACGRQFATYHGMRIHRRVHQRKFMVDLNRPPPPEEEEEEEEEVEEEGRNKEGK